MVVTTGAQNELFALPLARAAVLLEADASVRAVMPLPAVSDAISRPGMRASRIIRELLTAYADRPALGERMSDVVVDPRSGETVLIYRPGFRTITYRHLDRRVQAIARSWRSGSPVAVAPGRLVCLMGFASIDYASVDLACTYVGAVSVPLQTNMHADDLVKVLRETEPACLVASIDNLETAVRAVREAGGTIDVIVMDYRSAVDDQRRRLGAATAFLGNAGVTAGLSILDDVLHAPAPEADLVPPFVAAPDAEPLGTIFYTSGSTGSPKGAMFPERLWARWWSAPGLPIPMITLCYQPLNHGMGRFTVINALKTGGTCYFAARSDMSTLFEDARLVRPTVFDFVPRIAETIYHHFENEVARRISQNEGAEPDIRDQVTAEMRAGFLGGRVLNGIIGTAPSDGRVTDFIRRCFQIPLVDVFGSTETGPVTYNGIVNRNAVIDYRLREVPELGYFATDRPYPRGELLVKSRSGVAGYFQSPELTAELFVDGYIATGDIFEERGPDHIVWIDRRNNVQKLAQGEYVAISRIETILTAGDPLISSLYLYGNSKRAYTLAVVVPDLAVAERRLGHAPAEDELKALIRTALNGIGQAERLRAYEMPRDFIVEREPFTAANGLLSSVSKLVRPALKRRYGAALEALYADLDRRQDEAGRRLRAAAGSEDAAATLVSAVKTVLGIEQVDLSGGQSFTELGGDSLAAVSLATLLEELLDVEVPVGTILDPSQGLQGIVRHIHQAQRQEGHRRPSFSSIHGESGSGDIRVDDLKLHAFLDARTIEGASALAVANRPPRTVLLTGATGFLGRFLCFELLARLKAAGGRLVCIIRAADALTARQRLAEVFERGDPALTRRFAELCKGRLEVLAGDVSAPSLGLDEATFARLAGTVDAIFHPAALVNHMLVYRQLFEPNVLGTAEIIRLAATARRKRINFVSTIAAALQADGTWMSEEQDVRIARREKAPEGSYADGYATSKWAAEVLLREAHERLGLPVSVFRSDMIMPHSAFRGQFNAPDVFCRLLYSVMQTGLAPRSFGPDASSGIGPPAYDGLPVDFTAKAIVDIGLADGDGHQTYHVTNPHRDGATLDDIMNWIPVIDRSLIRISNYGDWLARFEAALRGLPEARRHLSSLAVLDQLRQPTSGGGPSRIECPSFRRRMAELAAGDGGGIPRLTRAYIERCARDIVGMGETDGRATTDSLAGVNA